MIKEITLTIITAVAAAGSVPAVAVAEAASQAWAEQTQEPAHQVVAAFRALVAVEQASLALEPAEAASQASSSVPAAAVAPSASHQTVAALGTALATAPQACPHIASAYDPAGVSSAAARADQDTQAWEAA